ncbi:Sulf_transp domain-containing protein [Methanocaldococcus lauensis]|uniref:Sulf_transp domain-containing protein n=1 Tax=Methanocaldococcus lauensis TaxID=2546128 RepID=A0A8D6SZY4_9EURY|nr:YeeE/YedE thiosulfate transporter family protein [Methanocaldococcus lauensis]CAB3288657.1 Sulf_transp domain-containing protein [Methanocaldococcus lauensis]
MEYLHVIGTFVFGIILGYLFQRARMCFVGGMRDFYLIKDTWLIKGLFGFFAGALIGYIIFSAAGLISAFPWFVDKGLAPIPGDPLGASGTLMGHLIVAIIGGFGVGFFSVIQGGCPLRNYVMAAEGNKTAIAYLIGLAVGAVIFHKFVVPLVKAILI